jgi:predicted phage terminase large subunit-like protein
VVLVSNLALEALYELQEQRKIDEERERLSHSLYDFVKEGFNVWKPSSQFVGGWHLQAVCEHLEAVSRGEIKRLQVWLPPGTMKSGLVSIFWPAWEWTWDPGMRFWTASYEVRFSGRLAHWSLGVMQSQWYQARWGDKFQFLLEGQGYFSNNQGGTRLATAPESTGAGEHGHRIIIDDPISQQEAERLSGVDLERVNSWFDSTVPTRGIDVDPAPRSPHAQVIVMQRLHDNDLAAHALNYENWEIICLPERYEHNHPYVWRKDHRLEGDMLWPEQRNEKDSAILARKLGIRAAGQLQQRPAAREGEILKREWWRFYDPRWRSDPKKLPKFGMVVVSVDTPLKDKETNDMVAIQAWGVRGPDRYLLDLDKGHMNYAKAKRRVKEMAVWARKLWPRCPHFLLIENAGYGVEMIIDLKRELTGVIKITAGAEGNKVTRAESASDALESGNVFVAGHGQPWQPAYDEAQTPEEVADLINSCAVFPMGAHDDDVDAWSQAHNWLRSKSTAPMRTSSAFRHTVRR